MQKINRIVLAACAALVLAACGPDEPPRPDHEIVAERAQARWDALLAGDYAGALAYYTPGFREQNSPQAFEADIRTRPVVWVSAEHRESTCDGERCAVEMLIGYRIPSGPAQLSGMGNERPVEETWIRIDGDWWFVPGG